jgi:uncharacterized membrane protein YheB (UPF0754 family)
MNDQLLLIPLISGFIGWATNALAILMMFRPLGRFGWGFLGWQGILPANAERMATSCVRLMTSRLLDVSTIFERVQPERISALLTPPLEKRTEEIVEDVLSERFPTLWETMPSTLRDQARNRVRDEIPQVVEKLMVELHEELDRYLDLEGLVVGAFVRQRTLLNEFFWRCGRKEFLFIIHSGLLLGTLFGAAVAAVWLFVQPSWFLPLMGLLVGWLTNWLALKMVFEPLEPRKIGPFTWQGLFLKRQAEVSEAYAGFFTEKVLYTEALVAAVLQGPAAERVVYLLQRYVTQAVDDASGPARPLVALTVGTREWVSLKTTIAERLAAIIPDELDRVHDYAAEALDIEAELQTNMSNLTPPEFEEVLRPVFREDEGTLIAVGALLGAGAGALQWLILVGL